MSQWFAPLDSALGGIADAITGATDTAGDATLSLLGFDDLGQWILMLAVVVVIALLVATQL